MVKRFVVSFGTLGVLLLLSLGGFFYYSSTPEFCRSCHNMEKYYDTWHASKHNKITCTLCHFEPGLAGTLRGKFQASALVVQYLTNSYSPKPFSKIKDASCLREGCHVKDKLGGTDSFMGKSAFRHQPHFGDKVHTTLTCTSCHAPLMGDRHIAVNETHCYLCHLRGADAVGKIPNSECVVCHNILPDVIPLGKRNIEHGKLIKSEIGCHECHSHVVMGQGDVSEMTCFKCHDFEERIKVREQKDKLHQIHLKAHTDCYLCHDEVRHKSEKTTQLEGTDCKTCHLAKHSGTKMMYSGRGAVGIAERPSPMYQAGVDCIGCHDTHMPVTDLGLKGKNLRTLKKRCVDCHNGDERYGDILDQWKGVIESRLSTLAEKLKEVEGKYGGSDVEADLQNHLGEARYNYQFVKEGLGVHNVGYAMAALDLTEKILDHILGIEEKGQPMVEDAAGEEIFWFRETEGLPPVRFDHTMHQSLFEDCAECHDRYFPMERGASDEQGLLTMSNMYRGRFCGGCHDGETATAVTENCEMCHIAPEKG